MLLNLKLDQTILFCYFYIISNKMFHFLVMSRYQFVLLHNTSTTSLVVEVVMMVWCYTIQTSIFMYKVEAILTDLQNFWENSLFSIIGSALSMTWFLFRISHSLQLGFFFTCVSNFPLSIEFKQCSYLVLVIFTSSWYRGVYFVPKL